jgi:hypothetical protein
MVALPAGEAPGHPFANKNSCTILSALVDGRWWSRETMASPDAERQKTTNRRDTERRETERRETERRETTSRRELASRREGRRVQGRAARPRAFPAPRSTTRRGALTSIGSWSPRPCPPS